MNSTQKIILAAIAGVAAGATAGVMLAPDKGKKTRKKLMRSAEDLIDETKESLKDLADKGMESVKS